MDGRRTVQFIEQKKMAKKPSMPFCMMIILFALDLRYIQHPVSIEPI